MPHTRINISDVRALWRPERIAQRIVNRQVYGTPVTDRFYPERTREDWGDVIVPVEEITRRTRAVPLVLRGAPGLSVPGDSGNISLIKPQPIKTIDGLTAAEYENRRLISRDSVQQVADRITDRHIDIHRKTREALAAQSLTGRIDYPLAGANGQVIDVFSVSFGTPHAFVPSVDWSHANTTVGQIMKDLIRLRTERAQKGYATTEIYLGADIFAKIVDKIGAYGNDQRVPARVNEDGSLSIAGIKLMLMAEQYDHPGLADFGQPGGAVTAGFKNVIAGNEVLANDSNAGWTMLNVRLDNFKLPPNPAPLGAIVELAEDGGQMNLYFESKPFLIPPAPAISRFDATATA